MSYLIVGIVILLIFLAFISARSAAKGMNGEKTPEADARVSEAYLSALEKVAKERKNQRFLNSNNEEAKIVTWLMTSCLRPGDEVLIYSKSLNPEFYEEVFRALSFLPTKLRFRIVLDDKEGTEVIKKFPQDTQSQVDCRLATTKDGSHILLTPVAFRAEAKESHNELLVVCNFYEPDKVQELKRRFERIWENSVPCLAA